MTPPAVSAQPPSAAAPPRATGRAPELRPRPPFSRPRSERPSLIDARTLGLSLALHAAAAVVVLLAPPAERPPPPPPAPSASASETVSYLDVGEWGALSTDPSATLPAAAAEAGISAGAADSVLLRPGASGVAFPERAPAGIPRGAGAADGGGGVGRDGGETGEAAGAGAAGTGAGRGRSGPGGMGPELGDPRLVVRPAAVPERVLSDRERYQRHFEDRVAAINDSIAGEADRERRRNNWTLKDRNGNAWGINDRGIVLGGRNVPVPVPNPIPRSARDREDEARRERDQREAIDRQADGIERDRHLRERQRAIRERADREREQRQREEAGETP